MEYCVRETQKMVDAHTTILPDGQRKINIPVFEDYIHNTNYLSTYLNGDI